MKNKHPAIRMIEDTEVDIQMQMLNKTGPCPLRLFECPCSNDIPGAFVGYSENKITATLVCQGRAVFDQCFKVIPAFCFLELAMLAFLGSQHFFKLFDCRYHLFNSLRSLVVHQTILVSVK